MPRGGDADADLAVLPGRLGDRRHVGDQIVRHGDPFRNALECTDTVGIEYLFDRGRFRRAFGALTEQRILLVLVGITDARLHDEPVYLRFREREGPLALDGILRCDHEKWIREVTGRPIRRNLLFRHGF